MPWFRFRPYGLRCVALIFLWAGLSLGAKAQPGATFTTLPLQTLAEFRAPATGWQIASGLSGDPRHQSAVKIEPGVGVLIANPAVGASPLVTTWEHSDLTIDFDFLLTSGASLSVWLQGRYPVMLSAPREKGALAVASRAAGLWQHARVEFFAPRFDAGGLKTSPAWLVKALINDFPVQEEVALSNPGAGAMVAGESRSGPLIWRAEGGPVELRKITYRRSGPGAVKLSQLAYKLYSGDFARVGQYDAVTPKSTGVPARLSLTAVEKTGRYALVFTGVIEVPQAGAYTFAIDGADPVRLTVDSQTVVGSSERGAQTGTMSLTAGAHPFRLDYLRATTSGRPSLEVTVSGAAVGWQLLTEPDSVPPRQLPPVLKIDPTNRVLVQRGFVPFEPKKRLYAISVGTPQGVHYAYDLETTALLRVWRGRFLDTGEMWVNRGENQYAKAAGPALTLSGLPSVALIEMPQSGGWPDRPDPLMSPQGYTLEPDGQPVFLTKLTDVLIKDRIAPSADGRGLGRRMEFSGALPSWQVCVLLADAESITPQPDGSGWIIGDRGYYLDWPKDSPHQPVLRNRGGRQLLVVPLSKATLGKPLNYEIVW